MAENSKTNKLPEHLHERVLLAKITRLEGALIKEIRDLQYGEIQLLIVKFDGEPVRIEVGYTKRSKNLQASEGSDLEDCEFVNKTTKDIEADNKRWLASKINK